MSRVGTVSQTAPRCAIRRAADSDRNGKDAGRREEGYDRRRPARCQEPGDVETTTVRLKPHPTATSMNDRALREVARGESRPANEAHVTDGHTRPAIGGLERPERKARPH